MPISKASKECATSALDGVSELANQRMQPTRLAAIQEQRALPSELRENRSPVPATGGRLIRVRLGALPGIILERKTPWVYPRRHDRSQPFYSDS